MFSTTSLVLVHPHSVFLCATEPLLECFVSDASRDDPNSEQAQEVLPKTHGARQYRRYGSGCGSEVPGSVRILRLLKGWTHVGVFLEGRGSWGTGEAHSPLIHLVQLGGGMQAFHNGRRLHTVHDVRISCQPFLQVIQSHVSNGGAM